MGFAAGRLRVPASGPDRPGSRRVSCRADGGRIRHRTVQPVSPRPAISGTVANICVHYTAASAALRWYDVVIPRDAISALDPFDLEWSLRQTDFLFAGRVTTAAAIRV